jgi:hypothetical protein
MRAAEKRTIRGLMMGKARTIEECCAEMVMAMIEERVIQGNGKVYNIGDLLKNDVAPPMKFCHYCGKQPTKELDEE